MHDTRARFSPAGPMQMTEGRCVVRPPSRLPVSSYHEPCGVPCVTSSQMRSWHSKASRPQRSVASLNVTWSFTTLIHTGASALPCTTHASKPASFIMPARRPPMLERLYHSGSENGLMPVNSQRADAAGTTAPENGVVANTSTFFGSTASTVLSSQ